MIKSLAVILGLMLLCGTEFLCYHFLREQGLSAIVSMVVTLTFCLGTFSIVVAAIVMRPADEFEDEEPVQGFGGSRSRAPMIPASRFESDSEMPLGLGYYPEAEEPLSVETQSYEDPGYEEEEEFYSEEDPLPAAFQHVNSEVYKDELRVALEQLRNQFAALLASSERELGNFDNSVLKKLEKNSPGSVEGVVIAKKIYGAIEQRVKDIERFLGEPPPTDTEKGQKLLLSDLEIPKENKLTTVFQTGPIPPIKISEVEFQFKVYLKRISRRRSIFRGSIADLADLA